MKQAEYVERKPVIIITLPKYNAALMQSYTDNIELTVGQATELFIDLKAALEKAGATV